MPKAKRKRSADLSSELGSGNFAIDYNARGRAIRKCRTQTRESTLDDSAIAISDMEQEGGDSGDDTDDDEEDEDKDEEEEEEEEGDDDDGDDDDDEALYMGDSTLAAPVKKRKRSPSPPAPFPSDNVTALSDSSLSEAEEAKLSHPSPFAAGTTLHLTVNIPAGHVGPITLHLDPKQFASSQNSSCSWHPNILAQTTLARLNARSMPETTKYAGFLDLPAELRNEIYRMIFVTKRPINFATPDNFGRSAALLRTSRQVHVGYTEHPYGGYDVLT